MCQDDTKNEIGVPILISGRFQSKIYYQEQREAFTTDKWSIHQDDTIIIKVYTSNEVEKELATHSSILAWRIPWTEELGRLQSIWSQSQT